MPNSKITAFSNSRTQKIYIDDKAREKGLTNLEVITGNVVDYEFEPESFDRVVSIEASVSVEFDTGADEPVAVRAYEELRVVDGKGFTSSQATREAFRPYLCSQNHPL